MKIQTLMGAIAALSVSGVAFAQETAPAPVDPNIFPPAKAGMTRHVLPVPAKENEGNYMIQIVAGQTLEVDCNRVAIGADLEEETLDGWGYDYYVIEDVSEPAQTLMGCPDGQKSPQMVTLNLGSDALIRYNSKLPIVVYAPENLSVGYRIYNTDGQWQDRK